MKNFLMEGGGAPSSASSATSTNITASTSASSTHTATDTGEGQPTSTTDSILTGTDGEETTSRRRPRTTSGFTTSRVSATATADNTCHTPAENSNVDVDP